MYKLRVMEKRKGIESYAGDEMMLMVLSGLKMYELSYFSVQMTHCHFGTFPFPLGALPPGFLPLRTESSFLSFVCGYLTVFVRFGKVSCCLYEKLKCGKKERNPYCTSGQI